MITLDGVTISRNNAEDYGGGMNVHVRDDSSTISNCTISNNRSYRESGGGLVFNQRGKVLTLTNNVITGNVCDNDGGGIYVQRGGVVIAGEDSLIANNKACLMTP